MLLLVMAGFVTGCGQKGALYHQAPASDDATTEQVTPSHQSGEHGSREQTEDR